MLGRWIVVQPKELRKSNFSKQIGVVSLERRNRGKPTNSRPTRPAKHQRTATERTLLFFGATSKRASHGSARRKTNTRTERTDADGHRAHSLIPSIPPSTAGSSRICPLELLVRLLFTRGSQTAKSPPSIDAKEQCMVEFLATNLKIGDFSNVY